MQQLFDLAVAGVLQQGKPAITELGSCRYRAPDGSKCAIGQLIPDEKYRKSFEDMSLDGVALTALGIEDRNTVIMLGDLQQAHDDAAQWPETFLTEFRFNVLGVASNHNLNTEVLDNG